VRTWIQGLAATYTLHYRRTGGVVEPTVRFAVTFPGRWVAFVVWDAAQGQWVVSDNRYAPTTLQFAGIQPNRWYWIGIWDYDRGGWVYGGWTGRVE
jgi:hypothetical protein